MTETPIAYHAGRYYHAVAFDAAVRYWVKQLHAQPFQRYALYTDDAYPFAVLLFALFHAGKEVWIAGNNHAGTAEQLTRHQCQLIGDWQGHEAFDYHLDSTDYTLLKPARSLRPRRFIDTGKLSPLNPHNTRLVIFTSGSTGQAKPIEKRLIQLERECATLEAQWGKQLGDAEVLATVSHQHIYGLLFRVLWPLSAGRCFHSRIAMNPEMLVNAIHKPACWIASPAQLKRLDADSPWQGISDMCAVFSSGGVLPETARQQIVNQSNQHVIEVYGSSETGGIAWRQHDTAWQLFDGLSLSGSDDNWQLQSPYLDAIFTLDDTLSLQTDGRFILHGRKDRIVKIEEKRLSLSELERRLMASPWIADAFTLTMTTSRDRVGAVIVLTEAGVEQLNRIGRNAFIKQLRSQLHHWFDAVVLPRKWLIVNTMPLTAQGKMNQSLLNVLLDTDTQKLPIVQSVSVTDNSVALTLKVPEELIYFPDHFAGYPILAGVVQIAWAEHFGNALFTINRPFALLEALKFVKVIQPNAALTLILNWSDTTHKLHFNFNSDAGTHSSGRLVYDSSQE